jgi:hypothetical protein
MLRTIQGLEEEVDALMGDNVQLMMEVLNRMRPV